MYNKPSGHFLNLVIAVLLVAGLVGAATSFCYTNGLSDNSIQAVEPTSTPLPMKYKYPVYEYELDHAYCYVYRTELWCISK